MQNNLPCVLTIGGTDPSGGAGIQADIKTISATGCYCASVISILVSQNTQGVNAINTIGQKFFTLQLESIFSDLEIGAIKIGMLYTTENIDTLSDFLTKYQVKNIILDPVFIAKDGSLLLEFNLINKLAETLFSKSNLITPNIFEAEKLLGKKITNKDQQAACAIELANKYKTSFLIKGGHLESIYCFDFLFTYQNQTGHWYSKPRIETNNTHGTGCSLSSAIASYCAQGHSLEEAISFAKIYLTKAIIAGKDLHIGKGKGPVDHFWHLRHAITRI